MVTTLPWATLEESARSAFAHGGAEPTLLAEPRTYAEAAAVLQAAANDGLAVVPWGGGTHQGLGNLPERAELVLSTRHLRALVEYEPADLTATVQAGMRFANLQALLAEHGQWLALDPPLLPGATVGGVFATNRSGPSRLALGTARDLLIGCHVANVGGTVSRAGGKVVKNVAGYDLDKLYVGAFGTLGVFVELNLRLAPLPQATAEVWLAFDSLQQAGAAARALVVSQLQPLAVELLHASVAQRLGAPARPCVVVRFGGYPSAVERQARQTQVLAQEHGCRRFEAPAQWAAVRDLALFPDFSLVVRASVAPAESAPIVERLEQALAGYEPAVWAHAGSGVAYAAVSRAADVPALRHALVSLRAQLERERGALVLEQAPAALRRELDAWGSAGQGLGLVQAIKRQLDPARTLNPGRLAGGI